MIDRWARLLVRRSGAVVVAGLVALLAAGAFGAGVFESLSEGGFEDPGSENVRELAAERDHFGNRNIDIVAVYSDEDRRATDPSFRADVEEALADVPDDVVSSTVTYYETGQPALLSRDGHATQVLISLQGTNQDELLGSWEELQPLLEADGLRTDLAGNYAVYADVNRISERDLQQAELISLPVVLVLSLLIFGSAVAAGMPVLVGVFTVAGAIAVVRLLSLFTEVSIFAVNVITLIGWAWPSTTRCSSSAGSARSSGTCPTTPTPYRLRSRPRCGPPAAPCCSRGSPWPRRCPRSSSSPSPSSSRWRTAAWPLSWSR